ncbi:MAG TPA: LLM class F420-dependent oxidoreductase [Micromonosporaceae bacterium]|nr:LLM class F420-dependent oxidoreductase [Micromonosporaceae bacterium]HCU52571.1 LLM class F420-dependent oxidoreductase [Micromonosporaceae bacterium]
MNVDSVGDFFASPLQLEAAATLAERDGYDGIAVPETRHDAFIGLTLAAKAATRIDLISSIAVAFARNPMTVAVQANDLQLISQGRFHLGLGSQVKAHIERRFSMPWGKPAARMEEFLTAVKAIWHSWETSAKLSFSGTFYQHTLMTEFFDPGPNPHGNPPILLAAVGERMAEVAGRVADGMLCHSLTTEHYLKELTLPALRRGRGDELNDYAICLPVLAVLGATPSDRATAEAAVRRQIAFYASTPAYRGVLDLHGWGELHEKLNLLSRQGSWDEMSGLISDDVLDAFAVSGEPSAVAGELRHRFGGMVTRLSLNTPYAVDPALIRTVAQQVKA